MDKELKDQVKQLVDSMFGEKEEANIRKRTEEELEKAASTISDLTTELESKNSEFEDMEEKIATSVARVSGLESELEAARSETEVALAKVAELETMLEGMMKDRAAEKRMAELEDAGVARSDRDAQITKIREMSNEDFASYRDELVSIRESVVAELEKARQAADAQAEAERVAKAAAASSEQSGSEELEEVSEEAEESEEATPPAKITPGQAAMAALNMEYIPSDDLVKKYTKLGEALANKYKKS